MNKTKEFMTQREQILKLLGSHPSDSSPYRVYAWEGERVSEEKFLQNVRKEKKGFLHIPDIVR